LVDRERLRYWLALGRVKSRARAAEARQLAGLIEKSKDAKELFDRGGGGKRGGSGAEAFAASTRLKKDDWEWVEEELDLAEEHGAGLITIKDRAYPPLLREVYDPPLLLYTKGKMVDSDAPAVAVVGTRRASPYGLAMAEKTGLELASAGVTVVSGMARGCDSAAHRGALSTAGGRTIAVLGTGIDRVYPRENKRLYEQIADKGLILSELPMSSAPLPRNFPMRNRIISGLCLGVVVVEAPLRSGAMMTARLALDSGRDVFAMPGHATSLRSSGTNKLIKDGAALVEGGVDILEALGVRFTEGAGPREGAGGKAVPVAPEARPELDCEGRLIFDILDDEPLTIDGIVEKTGLTAQRASSVLLDMELRGLVEQRPGKIFSRRL
jgi:DNA processing protein